MPFVSNNQPFIFEFERIPKKGLGVVAQQGGVPTIISFPAYITSLSTGFNGEWEDLIEIGRADPKQRYTQFGKTLSVSFAVIAESEDRNTLRCFRDLEALAQMTAPAYAGNPASGVFYSGNIGSFVVFSIGHLYKKEVGYISSLSYNWDITTYVWDTATQLPTFTEVSMEITWVGSGLAQKNYNFFDAQPEYTDSPPQPVRNKGIIPRVFPPLPSRLPPDFNGSGLPPSVR